MGKPGLRHPKNSLRSRRNFRICSGAIPCPLCAVFNHTLKVGAVVVRTRHSTVYVSIEYKYIAAFGILRTYAQLSVNALLGLAIWRITTIDDRCLHLRNLLLDWILFCLSTRADKTETQSKVYSFARLFLAGQGLPQGNALYPWQQGRFRLRSARRKTKLFLR